MCNSTTRHPVVEDLDANGSVRELLEDRILLEICWLKHRKLVHDVQ